MAKCRLLAFLLCERASVAPAPDNRVTLYHLFDRIIVVPTPEEPESFSVYFKIVVDEPCTVALRVINPAQQEIAGNWRDSIAQVGPIQGVWQTLDTSLFREPGVYVFELREESVGSESHCLASTRLVVEQEGK